MEEESLPSIRADAPEIRLGWSVPKLRRNYLANPFTRVPALVGAQYLRTHAPRRRRRAPSATGRIDAIMSHWALVTPRLARTIEQAGGELYVWTVDDRRASPSSTRWALPASSRTTRGCSLPRDLAGRARHAALMVLAVAMPGRRRHSARIDDLGAVAPLDVDDPPQHDPRPRLGGGKVKVVPPWTRRVPMPKRAQPASPPERTSAKHARRRRTTAGGCAPTAAARPLARDRHPHADGAGLGGRVAQIDRRPQVGCASGLAARPPGRAPGPQDEGGEDVLAHDSFIGCWRALFK